MILFLILNIALLICIWWFCFNSHNWSKGIHLQAFSLLFPFGFGLIVMAIYTNIFAIDTIKLYRIYIYTYSSINLLLLIPQWYKLAWVQLQKAQKKNWADTKKLFFVVIFAVLMVLSMVFLFALYFMWINSIGGNSQGLIATFDYQAINMKFADALYFSFVTYFTLGYGDLVPLGLWMRTFVFLECLSSVLNTGIIAVYAYNFLFSSSKKGVENIEHKGYKKV